MEHSKSDFENIYDPTFSSSMSWDIFPSTGTHRRWVGGADLMFQVVAARYESGSIVVTTNRKFRDWGKTFDVDNTLATAMIDRLMHHGEAILIEGGSYRTGDSND